MSSRGGQDFAPIAASLAREVRAYHARRAPSVPADARSRTVATNSELVEERAEFLLELLARRGLDDLTGRRVLDAGAGFGSLSALLAHRGASVVALDPNAASLAAVDTVAREHQLDLRGVVGRMEDPIPDGPYDAVLLSNSLCYILEREGRRRALTSLRAAARPGGVLVVRDLNRLQPLDPFTRVPLLHLLPARRASVAAQRLGRRRPHVAMRSARRLRDEIASSGWSDARIESAPSRRWIAGSHLHLSALRP